MTTLELIQQFVKGSRQQCASRNTDQTARITRLQRIRASSGKHNSSFEALSTRCRTRRWIGCGRRECTRCHLSIRASRPLSMTRSSQTHRHLFMSKRPTGFTPPGPIPHPLTPSLTGPAAFCAIPGREACSLHSRAKGNAYLHILSFSGGGLRASTYPALIH